MKPLWKRRAKEGKEGGGIGDDLERRISMLVLAALVAAALATSTNAAAFISGEHGVTGGDIAAVAQGTVDDRQEESSSP